MTEADAAALPAPPARRGRRSGRRSGRRRHVLRWVVLALILTPVLYVGITFVQVWRASHEDGARKANAAVVLGAAQYNGRPSPALEARLQQALDLYERDLVDILWVTGGRQEGDRFTEATTGYNWLRARGVPDENILKEVQGRTTFE